jgi:hypothetical protein
MAQKQRIWNDKWIEGDKLGAGGQANTFLTLERGSGLNQLTRVLNPIP